VFDASKTYSAMMTVAGTGVISRQGDASNEAERGSEDSTAQ